MILSTNETLFQEFGKIQRKMRQMMPPPYDAEQFPNPDRPEDAKYSPPHPPRRGRILVILHSAEEGMRQKEIAEIMEIGASATSQMIDKLEKDGFVKRIPDPDDRRATRIILTEEGTARAYEVDNEQESALERFFVNLQEEEKQQLIALLQKIRG